MLVGVAREQSARPGRGKARVRRGVVGGVGGVEGGGGALGGDGILYGSQGVDRELTRGCALCAGPSCSAPASRQVLSLTE